MSDIFWLCDLQMYALPSFTELFSRGLRFPFLGEASGKGKGDVYRLLSRGSQLHFNIASVGHL